MVLIFHSFLYVYQMVKITNHQSTTKVYPIPLGPVGPILHLCQDTSLVETSPPRCHLLHPRSWSLPTESALCKYRCTSTVEHLSKKPSIYHPVVFLNPMVSQLHPVCSSCFECLRKVRQLLPLDGIQVETCEVPQSTWMPMSIESHGDDWGFLFQETPKCRSQ